jgi:hypothetical protein
MKAPVFLVLAIRPSLPTFLVEDYCLKLHEYRCTSKFSMHNYIMKNYMSS